MAQRVAVYCRVSSNVDMQQHSLEAQQIYYEKLVTSNPEYIFSGMYVDTVSGLNKKKRKQFNLMLRDCRRKKIDLIITKSVSRFARNSVDFLKVIRELKKLNVDVYFETEQIKLSEERNEFRMTTHAAVAQEESMIKSGSIRWGLDFGFSTGVSGLANRTCYGYQHDPDDNLILDPIASENVKLIFDLYIHGYSLSKIAKELHIRDILSPTGKEMWTSAAIDKILSNEKYVGNVLLQKTYVPDVLKQTQVKNNGEIRKYLYENSHVGIIDAVIFDAVQNERKRRSNITVSEKGKAERNCNRFSSGNSLSGKIKCGECGKNFRRITTHSGDIVWRCAGRVEKGGKCSAEAIKQSTIDALLLEKFGGDISPDNAYKMVGGIVIYKTDIIVKAGGHTDSETICSRGMD
jgi:site-specific DNA recombinase